MQRDDDARMLDSIYAATWDPGALDEALDYFSRICRCRSAGVFHLHNTSLTWSHTHNMPASFMDDFATVAPRDPRIAYALQLPPMTVLRDDLPALQRPIQAAGIDRFARHYDLPHTVACNLGAEDSSHALALFTSRSNREGLPDAEHVAAFARYAPHFSRAFALRRQMCQAQIMAARAQSPETTPQPGRLLLDGAARVRWLDGSAQHLLETSDGVSLFGGRLRFADPDNAHQLNAIAHALMNQRVLPDSNEIRIMQSDAASALVLRLIPNTAAKDTRAPVLVLLRRIAAPTQHARPTPRQQEVLQLLAQGLPSKEIGRHLNIADNTVRNHVQELLRLLDAPTRGACVARARKWGWLD